MKKYKVSQELMNEIDEWRGSVHGLVVGQDLMVGDALPSSIYDWWMNPAFASEKNNRLIALIQYVNGEDVFEIEKPKKWVVRSKERPYDSSYRFVALYDDNASITTDLARAYTAHSVYGVCFAFKFDSKEEAKKWTNPLMEVVEWEER